MQVKRCITSIFLLYCQMKLEEIGWTFVSLFTEDGSVKSGESMNLTVFKFPLVK